MPGVSFDMSKHSLATLAAVSAVALTAAGAHAGSPNLVVNGGFEMTTPDSAGYTSFEVDPDYNPHGATLVGWQTANSGIHGAFNILFNPVGATSVEPDTRYTPPKTSAFQYLWKLPSNPDPNGGNFIALDGDTQYNGPLFQTVHGLTAGDTYTLSFSWAAAQIVNRAGKTTEKLEVTFGGTTITTPTVANASKSATPWVTETYTVKATSANELLSFLSIGTPNGMPPLALLDGVSLTAGGVPEPSTWALMTLALGGVGVAARANRRRRLAVPA